MDPVTGVFLAIALWNVFYTPEPTPIPCQFTERVVIRKGKDDVEGDLTTFYVCDQMEIVERLGAQQ